MKRLKKGAYFGLAVLAAIGLSLSPAGAVDKVYTLSKSIQEALANNWSLQAKKEKIEGAVYANKRAKTDFMPAFKTSYSYTRLDGERISPATPIAPERPLNTQDNYLWKGTITQPLFTGFALTSAYELSKLGIDQSEMELDLEKLDLVLRVKESYFNILKADKAVEVTQKAVEGFSSHVKVAKSFYDVGMIPINDLLKAEVELSNAQYELVRSQNAAKITRANFNVVLARPVNEPVSVEDIVAYEPETGNFETYLEKALINRPEIKTIELNLLQTDQQIRLAKSKYYPEVALNYDYIREGDHFEVAGSEFHDSGRWQVTAALTWTFWEWGKTGYDVREKESLRTELMKTRESLKDSISLQIKQAILDLEQEEKNIPTTRKAVEQGEENLRVSQERYKAQVTTSTEVLDAQTLLTQARVNYYGALYDRNLAKARLLRSMGEY
ncbi:MAG: TolC family protein [Pseudomonadota bacterium]